MLSALFMCCQHGLGVVSVQRLTLLEGSEPVLSAWLSSCRAVSQSCQHGLAVVMDSVLCIGDG